MSKPRKDGANADMARDLVRKAMDASASSNEPSLPGVEVEPEFQPERTPVDVGVDGRSLRKTHREPFATRIKPETHRIVKQLAFDHRVTMAEVIEHAVAAYVKSFR